MTDTERKIVIAYLGAKDGASVELHVSLERFLEGALERIRGHIYRTRPPSQWPENVGEMDNPAGDGALSMLIEAWIAANPTEDPLWEMLDE